MMRPIRVVEPPMRLARTQMGFSHVFEGTKPVQIGCMPQVLFRPASLVIDPWTPFLSSLTILGVRIGAEILKHRIAAKLLVPLPWSLTGRERDDWGAFTKGVSTLPTVQVAQTLVLDMVNEGSGEETEVRGIWRGTICF